MYAIRSYYEQVISIQDRTISLQLRAGYATATVAKLFEMAHKAKDYYEQAFYRSLYIGAENSIGFHNPTEAMRNLGDSIAFAVKAEAFLRQALTQAGVAVPMKVDLELAKYRITSYNVCYTKLLRGTAAILV